MDYSIKQVEKQLVKLIDLWKEVSQKNSTLGCFFVEASDIEKSNNSEEWLVFLATTIIGSALKEEFSDMTKRIPCVDLENETIIFFNANTEVVQVKMVNPLKFEIVEV